MEEDHTPHRRRRPKDAFDLWASLAVALLIDRRRDRGRPP